MAQVSTAQNNNLLSQLLEIAKYDSKRNKITIVDDESEINITYVGVAQRPADGHDPVWLITKIDENASDPLFPNTNITILTSDPNVRWIDRLFIPYNAERFEAFDVTFDNTFG